MSTLDFFSPNHPDPFTFGQIAAANALSDVFAMGGEVMYALNILGVPKGLDPDLVAEILKGAIEKVNEAGGVVVGGHTVTDDEIKYGLSVTGKVTKDRLLTNDGAKPGCAIILTKKIGVGVYNNRYTEDAADSREVVASMTALNNVPSELFVKYGIKSCTDVTGFGLGGHLIEVMEASNVTAELVFDDIPMFERTKEFSSNISGGMRNNILFFGNRISHKLTNEDENIIFDPQTSGGLLLFVEEEKSKAFVQDLHNAGFEVATEIGKTTVKQDVPLIVK